MPNLRELTRFPNPTRIAGRLSHLTFYEMVSMRLLIAEADWGLESAIRNHQSAGTCLPGSGGEVVVFRLD
jgi:hypothetical protein